MFNHQSSSISSYIERCAQLAKKLSLPDVLCVTGCSIGAVLVAVGTFQLVKQGGVGGQLPVVEAATVSEDTSTEVRAEDYSLVVEVAGAVIKPGVYVLPQGSRVSQALEQAGGLTAEADQQQTAATLNLAQEVTDQQKIYVPFIGENQDLVSSAGSGSEGVGENSESKAGGVGVSVNTATTAELMELEGIGEKRAEDIVAQRPYQSLDELLSKKVLTQTLFDKLSTKLRL